MILSYHFIFLFYLNILKLIFSSCVSLPHTKSHFGQKTDFRSWVSPSTIWVPGWSSGQQAWWQGPQPAEPSPRLIPVMLAGIFQENYHLLDCLTFHFHWVSLENGSGNSESWDIFVCSLLWHFCHLDARVVDTHEMSGALVQTFRSVSVAFRLQTTSVRTLSWNM